MTSVTITMSTFERQVLPKKSVAHPAATAHALEVGRQVALPMTVPNKVIRLKSHSIHEAFTTSWIKKRTGCGILYYSRREN